MKLLEGGGTSNLYQDFYDKMMSECSFIQINTNNQEDSGCNLASSFTSSSLSSEQRSLEDKNDSKFNKLEENKESLFKIDTKNEECILINSEENKEKGEEVKESYDVEISNSEEVIEGNNSCTENSGYIGEETEGVHNQQREIIASPNYDFSDVMHKMPKFKPSIKNISNTRNILEVDIKGERLGSNTTSFELKNLLTLIKEDENEGFESPPLPPRELTLKKLDKFKKRNTLIGKQRVFSPIESPRKRKSDVTHQQLFNFRKSINKNYEHRRESRGSDNLHKLDLEYNEDNKLQEGLTRRGSVLRSLESNDEPFGELNNRNDLHYFALQSLLKICRTILSTLCRLETFMKERDRGMTRKDSVLKW